MKITKLCKTRDQIVTEKYFFLPFDSTFIRLSIKILKLLQAILVMILYETVSSAYGLICDASHHHPHFLFAFQSFIYFHCNILIHFFIIILLSTSPTVDKINNYLL